MIGPPSGQIDVFAFGQRHLFGDVAEPDVVHAQGADHQRGRAVPVGRDVGAACDGHRTGIVLEIPQRAAGRGLAPRPDQRDEAGAEVCAVTEPERARTGIGVVQVDGVVGLVYHSPPARVGTCNAENP